MKRLALVLALVFTACSGSSGPKRVDTQSASVFVLPSYVPVGFRLTAGHVFKAGGTQHAYAAVIAKRAAVGFDDAVLVLVQPAAADRAIGAQEQQLQTAVDINGTNARLSDTALVGATVDWFTHGLAVSVLSKPGTRDRVVDVARRLQLPTDARVDEVRIDGVPDGFTLVAGQTFDSHTPEYGCEVLLQSGGNASADIRIDSSASRAPLVLALGFADHIEPITIRGHDGYAASSTRQVNQTTSFTQSIVAWQENGHTLSVTGNAGIDNLKPIADGLHHVSEDEWRKAVPVPTTVPVPTSKRP
jgi:hypothetical protein